MLSYQHSYHAGNPADVQKHDALARVLTKLTEKARPITYMETHAGRGLYDLGAPEALKTGEAQFGIEATTPSGAYGKALAEIRSIHGPKAYPGSPLIARTLLRDIDRMHLMELHPTEHAALRKSLKGKGAAIHKRDGYEGVLAISPPTPRKGLVLIDPSYEVKTEYQAVPSFIRKLVKRWPEVTILIWYPILPDAHHKTLLKAIAPHPFQLWEVPVDMGKGKGMTGSGMIGVNLPYGLDLAPEK